MSTEQQLRAKAAAIQAQVDALNWLDEVEKAMNIPKEHSWSCESEDLTGHPAPCNCGFDAKTRISHFIRNAILAHNS